MADIKWIKLSLEMFSDEKMLLIEDMPERDTILIMWVKLLSLAGRSNASGYLLLNQNIPYNDEMLASIFKRPINSVRMALEVFKRFGMINIDDDTIRITNWIKHQNVEGMEKIKEQTKNRVEKHRQNKKLLGAGSENTPEIENISESENIPENENIVNPDVTVSNVTCNVTVTECNATDLDLELDLDLKDLTTLNMDNFDNQIDEIKSTEDESSGSEVPFENIDNPLGEIKNPDNKSPGIEVPLKKIQDLYNATCVKLPKCRDINGQRKKHVRALYKQHPDLAYFEDLFAKANASSFLTGTNARAWSADFDWIINPTNRTKILEDKYLDKPVTAQNGYSNAQNSYKVPQLHNFEPHNYSEEDLEKYYFKFTEEEALESCP